MHSAELQIWRKEFEEIGDARANLAAAPPLAANDIASKQLSEETAQHQANEREANRVKTILEISARMRSGVVDIVAGVTGMHRRIPPSGRNRELILKIEDVFDTAAKDFVIALEQASAALLEADNRVEAEASPSNCAMLTLRNRVITFDFRSRTKLRARRYVCEQNWSRRSPLSTNWKRNVWRCGGNSTNSARRGRILRQSIFCNVTASPHCGNLLLMTSSEKRAARCGYVVLPERRQSPIRANAWRSPERSTFLRNHRRVS